MSSQRIFMIAFRTSGILTISNNLRARSRLLIQQNYRSTQARCYTSPYQKFMDTIREGIQKNKELQQNVKLLQDQAGQLGESDTLRRAKEVYTKAKV
jgi:mitochondrial import inner membrane translocase subunit TIM44